MTNSSVQSGAAFGAARPMKRRALMGGIAALATAGTARANEIVMGPPTPMGIPKRVFVSQPAVIRQNCPEWCWAASIAMIFAYHNHPVAQETIVAQTFGNLACQGSRDTATIGRDLSRSWTDINGRTFRSQVVAAYDPMNGIFNMNNGFIRSELAANRPLLYCNTHHAMVNVTFEFYESPMGIQPISAGVLDPWPGSPPFHPLTMAEMVPLNLQGQMTFLAAVQVI